MSAADALPPPLRSPDFRTITCVVWGASGRNVGLGTPDGFLLYSTEPLMASHTSNNSSSSNSGGSQSMGLREVCRRVVSGGVGLLALCGQSSLVAVAGAVDREAASTLRLVDASRPQVPSTTTTSATAALVDVMHGGSEDDSTGTTRPSPDDGFHPLDPTDLRPALVLAEAAFPAAVTSVHLSARMIIATVAGDPGVVGSHRLYVFDAKLRQRLFYSPFPARSSTRVLADCVALAVATVATTTTTSVNAGAINNYYSNGSSGGNNGYGGGGSSLYFSPPPPPPPSLMLVHRERAIVPGPLKGSIRLLTLAREPRGGGSGGWRHRKNANTNNRMGNGARPQPPEASATFRSRWRCDNNTNDNDGDDTDADDEEGADEGNSHNTNDNNGGTWNFYISDRGLHQAPLRAVAIAADGAFGVTIGETGTSIQLVEFTDHNNYAKGNGNGSNCKGATANSIVPRLTLERGRTQAVVDSVSLHIIAIPTTNASYYSSTTSQQQLRHLAACITSAGTLHLFLCDTSRGTVLHSREHTLCPPPGHGFPFAFAVALPPQADLAKGRATAHVLQWGMRGSANSIGVRLVVFDVKFPQAVAAATAMRADGDDDDDALAVAGPHDSPVKDKKKKGGWGRLAAAASAMATAATAPLPPRASEFRCQASRVHQFRFET